MTTGFGEGGNEDLLEHEIIVQLSKAHFYDLMTKLKFNHDCNGKTR